MAKNNLGRLVNRAATQKFVEITIDGNTEGMYVSPRGKSEEISENQIVGSLPAGVVFVPSVAPATSTPVVSDSTNE